jgi:hypothetical protein
MRFRRTGWWVLGGVGVVLVAAVGVWLVAGDGGPDGRPGECRAGLAGLADHLPSVPGRIDGADLAGARESGLDDETLEELRDQDVPVFDPLNDTSEGEAPFRRTAVGCWLGSVNGDGDRFVASGAFDDLQGESDSGSEGSIAVDGDLLAYERGGDPAELLATREPSEALRHLVEAFDRHGAICFVGNEAITVPPLGSEREAAGPEPWGGLALARRRDWELLAVWAFVDGEAAEAAAEPFVRRMLQEASNMGDVIDADPAGQLARDGPSLWFRAPFTPADLSLWSAQEHDPIFTSFGDYVHFGDSIDSGAGT